MWWNKSPGFNGGGGGGGGVFFEHLRDSTLFQDNPGIINYGEHSPVSELSTHRNTNLDWCVLVYVHINKNANAWVKARFEISCWMAPLVDNLCTAWVKASTSLSLTFMLDFLLALHVLAVCFQAVFQNWKCGSKMTHTAESLVISFNTCTQLDSVTVWKAKILTSTHSPEPQRRELSPAHVTSPANILRKLKRAFFTHVAYAL